VVRQHAVSAAVAACCCTYGVLQRKKEKLQQQLLPLAQANTQNVSIDNFY